MEPNKVYKSLVYLAYNVVRHERLRFEMDNKAIFRDQFVKQVNNMLALEKDFNQIYNNQTWTNVFAQAIVKITQQKQRFEKRDGLSVEEIYADYSSFLSYVSTTFEIGRNTLTDETVNFTSDEVLIDAILTEQTKNHYRELEKERIAAEQKEKEEAKEKPRAEFKQEQPYKQANSGFFSGGPFQNVNTINPMQNPRFYPYFSKPRWMPTLKYVFAGLVIFATLMLIATSIAMMSVKMYLGPNEAFNNPFGRALFGEQWIDDLGGDWNKALKEDLQGKKFPLYWSLMTVNTGSILSLIFYCLPAIYIGYYVFRKPRSLKEKYRLGIFPVLFMLIMFFVAGMNIFNFMSAHQISKNFDTAFQQIFDKKFTVPAKGYDFKAFWDVMMEKHGAGINTVTIFADCAVALIAVSFVLGIVILVLNPRMDREKMMRASMEMQRAQMAMMQGQSYQIDESLFDDETQTIKPKKASKSHWYNPFHRQKNKEENKANKENKNKFSAWWKKTFRKNSKNQKSADQQSQADNSTN